MASLLYLRTMRRPMSSFHHSLQWLQEICFPQVQEYEHIEHLGLVPWLVPYTRRSLSLKNSARPESGNSIDLKSYHIHAETELQKIHQLPWELLREFLIYTKSNNFGKLGTLRLWISKFQCKEHIFNESDTHARDSGHFNMISVSSPYYHVIQVLGNIMRSTPVPSGLGGLR